MTDIRLLGRFAAVETVEDIPTDVQRWILCSEDFARGGAITNIVAEEENGVSSVYPIANVNDGDRRTWASTTDHCSWVQFVLDLVTTRRKSLLWLEYFDGDEVEFAELEMSNAAAGPWHSILGELAYLYRGPKYSLIKLPYDSSAEQKVHVLMGSVSETTTSFAVTPTGYEDGHWVGAYAIPQAGANAGMPRRIMAWTAISGLTVIESPWPYAMAAGDSVLYKKFAANYLGNRYMRIKLRSRWHPNQGPVRLSGLSVFDFDLVLKGDQDAFARTVPGNPSGVTRSPAGMVLHQQLNGGVTREELSRGARRKFKIDWGVVPAGLIDFVEGWASRGNVGIVDELGRDQQVAVTNYSEPRLPTAVNRGEESKFMMEVVET